MCSAHTSDVDRFFCSEKIVLFSSSACSTMVFDEPTVPEKLQTIKGVDDL
ncbi:MAG: cyclic lactone autoinducer peptide [Deltaproteobacteria bacterium]|nr:cyclic lactone autoinducer peptide [Deltaproteobacteria bacterium]MBN2688375.1 cyclic lactone autoinducer peptide [Deltaproteobacteria bacterium]